MNHNTSPSRVTIFHVLVGTGLCGLALTVPGLIWPDFGLELVAVCTEYALTVLLPAGVLAVVAVVTE